jgi:membrane-bound lytic murein transglycosylase D
MRQSFFRFFILLSCITIPLSLTGCIADKSFSLLREFQGFVEEPVMEEHDDPEMQLVLSEQEVCLNQELKVLSETGQWVQETTETTDPLPPKEVKYDFPVVMNKQVNAYIELYKTRQHNIFSRWLARSSRYLPYMKAEFKKAGLPEDLAYLSMIESGFNQRAYSRARAVGLWQFMSATGRQYNLAINKYIDERRDMEKSTAAAIAFLSDLYNDFGDWHLAVAAYNAGPGKVRSGLRRHGVTTFWDLAQKKHLRLETKRYVPKLIAAIIISKEPEKYGFTNIKYADPIEYESLEVGPGLSLEAVALISGSKTKAIKELNPELRKGKTPLNTDKYFVKIPSGSLALAKKNVDRLHRYVSTGYRTHTIKRSETVRSICKKYNINTTTLLKVNNLRSQKLVAGTNLRIPYSTVKYQLLPEGDKRQLAAYKDNLILHKIRNGETISKIATRYGVPEEMIVSWNGLKSVHRIRAGQQLALYIKKEGGPANKPKQTASPQIMAGNNKILAAKTTKQLPVRSQLTVLSDRKKRLPAPSDKGGQYEWYQVRNGDSIWKISRKFNISTAQIRKWNNLKSNLIHPGNRLKLKKV